MPIAWSAGARAGLEGKLGCHVFRATGITAYLEAGGTLENAQAMAAHESPRKTKLYGRTGNEITLTDGNAARSLSPPGQCSGPVGVVFESCATASLMRRQTATPS